MSIIATPEVGMEVIQRAAFLQLFANLNDAMVEVAAHRDISDQDFATQTGRSYVETILEPVEDDNFFEGHIPSLVNGPITRYPNVAVLCSQATPGAGSDQLDQLFVYRTNLIVDVMVKSATSEEEVNRRVHRTAEAAQICITRDTTLGGTVSGLETTPSFLTGNVFTKKERTAYGPHFYWQGARLEYGVRKEAGIASATGPIFDIDQN